MLCHEIMRSSELIASSHVSADAWIGAWKGRLRYASAAGGSSVDPEVRARMTKA